MIKGSSVDSQELVADKQLFDLMLDAIFSTVDNSNVETSNKKKNVKSNKKKSDMLDSKR